MRKVKMLSIIMALIFSLCGCVGAEPTKEPDINNTADSAVNTDIGNSDSAVNNIVTDIESDGTVINEQGDSDNSDSPNPEQSEQTEQDEAEPFQIPDNLHLDSKYSVVDGKVLRLLINPSYLVDISLIENAEYVEGGRFVFCSDGTVVDLYGDPDYWMGESLNEGESIEDFSGKDITLSLVTELYTTCGVHDVVYNEISEDNVFRLYAGDGYSYEFYLPALSYTKAEDPHIESDGSVFSEEYPELSAWTDVVELRKGYDCQNNQVVFIGLTSSGNVLSYGIDFTPENIVKIQIYNTATDIVIGALTIDGKIVFSEGTTEDFSGDLYNAIQKAKEFTDVQDFIISSGSGSAVVLVKKKDGTLHATENHYYNPELVASP